MGNRVLHVRGADVLVASRIDAWLAAHRCDVVDADDGLDACLHLLDTYRDPAELVIIGWDALPPEDRLLLLILRETWPRVAVLVYGAGAPSVAAPLECVCRGQRELDDLLQLSPVALAARLRGVGGGASDPHAAEAPASAGASSAAQERATALRFGPLEPPPALLTSEELSALLDPRSEP